MKNLLLASLIILATALACTPKEGATTPENEPAANNATNNAANNATNNATPTDPAPEADGKGAPNESEGK